MSVTQRYFLLRTKIIAWRTGEANSLHVCTFLLYHMGLWPGGQPQSPLGSLPRYLVPRLVLGMNLFSNLLGHPVKTYQSWGGDDLYLISESVSGSFVAALMLLNMYILLFRRGQLTELLQAAEQMKMMGRLLPIRPGHVAVERDRNMTRFLNAYLGVSMVLIVSSYNVVPELLARRDFLYHAWYPFDNSVSPVYEAMFSLEIFCHAYLIYMMLFFNIVFMCLLAETISQLRLLSDNLLNLRQDPSKTGEPRNNFSGERLVNGLQAMYSMFLGSMLLCTLVPSGIGIVLAIFAPVMNGKLFMHMGLVVSSYLITSIYCWLSDKIAEENEGLGMSLYGCDWLRASEGFKRSMRIIMSRSKQHMHLKAAGFIPMTMETFYATMRLTYTYTMAMVTQFRQRVRN